jgi:hypothetical protein
MVTKTSKCKVCDESIRFEKLEFEGTTEWVPVNGVYFEEEKVHFCEQCWAEIMEPLKDKYKEFLKDE